MEEQSGTLNVALSNMGDAFSKLVKAIGDAGLTKILTGIANAIKWLADKVTKSIPLFNLGFKAIVAEVIKFGNLFIAVLRGVGRAFSSFGDAISNRFEALGKDLANFIDNPLGGVTFENTRKALETGLLDTMGAAFDEAIKEAKDFNKAIDAEVGAAADKIVEANAKKAQGIADLFKKANTVNGTKGKSKTSEANKKLEKESKKTTDKIGNDFEKLGKKIEGDLVDALDATSDNFGNFKDLAKNALSEINQMMIKSALDGFGVTGKGGMIQGLFSGLGGLFGGGGGAAAGASGGGFGGIISGITSAFGGFFADGGTLKAGQFGVVGERGPELAFAGSRPLNISPNQSAPVTVNMNITSPDVQGFRQSQTQIAADMARAIEKGRRNL